MKVTRKMKVLLAGILFLVLSFCLLGNSRVISATAEEEFTLDAVAEECAEMTSSDVLAPLDDGTVYTLQDYMENIGMLGLQGNDALHDELVRRIVPEELFFHPGDWYYGGIEYSFYVGTWKPLGLYDYMADLVLIDNVYEFDEGKGEIRVRAELFSVECSVMMIDGVPFVRSSGSTQDDYFLNNVQCFTMIANEHKLNIGDKGYNKMTDEGMYIRQTRMNYSGICGETISFDPSDLIEVGLDVVIGALKLSKEINWIYNTISTLISSIEALGNAFTREDIEIEMNNEANIYSYPMISQQRQNDELDGLIRFVTVMPADDGLMVDDYAEFITMLDDEESETRLTTGIFYNLYSRGISSHADRIILGNGEVYTNPTDLRQYASPMVTTFSDLVYEETTTGILCKELEEGSTRSGYLFDGESEEEFKFTPSKSGTYTFTSGTDIRMKVRDGATLLKKGYGTVSVYLMAGRDYNIHVTSRGSSFGSYQISVHGEVVQYSIVASINADILTIGFTNELGQTVSDPIYKSISIYYTALDGSKQFLTQNVISADLSLLPTIGGSAITISVTYNAQYAGEEYSQSLTIEYATPTFGIWETPDTSGTRLAIDARGASQSGSNSITIPANIVTLNLCGDFRKMYQYLNFEISSRTQPLTINMYYFQFTSDFGPGIFASLLSGQGDLIFNASEYCTIKTVGSGATAITASTMTMNSGELSVFGGGRESGNCGMAINLGSALIMNGGTLYAKGGDGIYNESLEGTGRSGAYGGTGIQTYGLQLNGGKLDVEGGDGGAGMSGNSGQKGGNGGSGGAALVLRFGSPIGSGTTVELHGGHGGRGGNGGSGAVGGNGGSGGAAYLLGSVESTFPGAMQMNGADGSDGANG